MLGFALTGAECGGSFKCGCFSREGVVRWIFVLAALTGLVPWLQAQTGVAPPGSRIRIHVPASDGSYERGIEGTIVGMTGDTLTLRPRSGGPHRIIPAASTAQAFRYMGRRWHTARGAVIGGTVGLLVGGLVGAVAGKVCSDEDSVLCGQRRQVALKASLLVGAVGAATGVLIGTLTSDDVWIPTLLTPVGRPSLSFGAGGPGLRFSFTF